MGLRVNTNVAQISALRNLAVTDKRQSSLMEKLSTGLRINRAGDDPSGLVISEVLRSQVSSLKQAAENTQNANNLISTTEASLNEINTLLVDLRASAIFALNTGGTSTEQIAAEQDAVDYAISAIKRIADTSRYGTTQLLNGASGFDITQQSTSGILNVNPYSMQFNPATSQTTIEVKIASVASQACVLLARNATAATVAASGGAVTLRVRGDFGAEEISLASGATNADLAQALNLLRGNMGIYASGGFGYSEGFGTDSVISIEQIGGSGTFSGGSITTPGFTGLRDRYSDYGQDATATVAGERASARGNFLKVVSTFFTGTIDLNPSTNQDPTAVPGGPGTYTFTVKNTSGLLFHLNMGTPGLANEQKVIGLPNVVPSLLGQQQLKIGGVTTGGNLTSMVSGGDSDLFNNPANALKVIDGALSEISSARSYLGAFVADTLEPNSRSLEVAIENMSASESSIRDLDFASAVADMTKYQVLFQAGISVLSQANMIPQSVLQLLK